MSELPDVDIDTLNDMIRDLAREMGCPHWVYPPDLVELDHIPGHVYGYNRGCDPDGLERYKAGQMWRRKIIRELKERSEWIVRWRAEQNLNRRIRELSERKELRFAPWETPPWAAPDELPEDFRASDWSRQDSLPQAVRLRRQLIRELAAEGCPEPRRDDARGLPLG